jgi:hypothetical protein
MRVSPCGFDGSFIEPLGIQYRELISGGNPLSEVATCIDTRNKKLRVSFGSSHVEEQVRMTKRKL